MRRRLRAVVAGLMVVGAGAVAGTAAADGAGPVATPPDSPKTQTVAGVAANGVQLSMTAPAQLPLDLPGQQLPEREVDVTVKDAGGQGYTGTVTMTLTSEGSGVSATALRLDRYDQASGSWQTVPVSAGGASVTVSDDVTVPASGTQVLKLRMSPGTTVVDDVKVSASANGATAVASVPVTGPAFRVSGLTGSGRAGSPMVITGTLDNPTDLSLQDVPVKLLLCSGGSAGCVAHASDVKVEEQTGGGSWHTVSVSDATATSPMSATVVPQLTVPAGGSAQFLVRVTVGAGAFAAPGQTAGQPTGQTSSPASAQPMSVAVALSPVGLTFVTQPTVSGTLTVQPPAATPTTPSSTPSSSATSATSAPTASQTTTDDSATAAPTASPTPDPASTTEAASTPDAASSSSNPTILVAVGLLAVCLALVLWWVLMKRRERLAPAGAGHGHDGHDGHEYEHGHDHGHEQGHDHGDEHGDEHGDGHGDGQAHGIEQ